MTRYPTWIPAVLLATLAGSGIWLVIAPFAVGYQPRGDDWTLATRNDVTSGAILLGVCLLTLAASLAATARARLRHIRSPQPAAPADHPPGRQE